MSSNRAFSFDNFDYDTRKSSQEDVMNLAALSLENLDKAKANKSSFGFRTLESMPYNTKPSDVLTLARNNICLPSPGLDHSTFDLELISNMLGPGTPFDPNYCSFDLEDPYDLEGPCKDYINRYTIRLPDPTTKMPPKLCNKCSMVHSPSELCHEESCEVCYSKCHLFSSCPYLDYFPRGADFDRASYEVHCRCGYPFFDTTTWVCSAKYCGGPVAAKLCLKMCDICGSSHEHTTFECPKDKDLAAFFKSKMEIYFERRGWTPLSEILAAEAQESSKIDS